MKLVVLALPFVPPLMLTLLHAAQTSPYQLLSTIVLALLASLAALVAAMWLTAGVGALVVLHRAVLGAP